MYKVVQTGKNTQLGGLNAGWLRLAYQVAMDGVVNNEETYPTARQTTIQTIIETIALCFFVFIFLL